MCFNQIANTLSNSTNKVYLNADSLMINTLGEETGISDKPAKQATSGSYF